MAQVDNGRRPGSDPGDGHQRDEVASRQDEASGTRDGGDQQGGNRDADPNTGDAGSREWRGQGQGDRDSLQDRQDGQNPQGQQPAAADASALETGSDRSTPERQPSGSDATTVSSSHRSSNGGITVSTPNDTPPSTFSTSTAPSTPAKDLAK